ncbi:hypothetical protein P5G65_01410 [Paenibacillus chondroitinus]|uniref:Uncharacterized protein n=2 Tax=Paenibacillus chondroitinus TaxID=59842 RepID=A0ABU6D6G4_9BACL|nr:MULTISPECIES: hypothetical protein [Paenibacillus]MCY9661289.1 hypothetical protein [Paenibacillus anseongense]MEB4792543.1 hypothetical protein [Paenibacillus chondroitinus]
MYCLQTGIANNGTLIARPKIVTGAIVLSGGKVSVDIIKKNYYERLEDGWPEILLFLDAGIVTIKDIYEGYIDIYRAGEDALLVFMKELLKILSYRTSEINGGFYLDNYLFAMRSIEFDTIEYPLTRPPYGQRGI